MYLQEARKHEKRRPEALDRAALLPEVEVREQLIYEREPLIVGLSFALVRCARADRSLRDSEVVGALTAVARQVQSQVNSGLLVPTAPASLPQQAVTSALEAMAEEYRQTEHKHLGYSTLKDSELLQALVFLLRMAHTRSNGRPRSRAFLDFVMAQFPAEPVIASRAEPGRIIMP